MLKKNELNSVIGFNSKFRDRNKRNVQYPVPNDLIPKNLTMESDVGQYSLYVSLGGYLYLILVSDRRIIIFCHDACIPHVLELCIVSDLCVGLDLCVAHVSNGQRCFATNFHCLPT